MQEIEVAMSVSSYIEEAFSCWCDQFVSSKYRFGDKEMYNGTLLKVKGQNSFNKFIKTEADIKVKFGGYLESYFMKKKCGLIVHSEMRIYPNFRFVSDLSVHEDILNDDYGNYCNDTFNKSLRAVIEIKYANFRDPNYDFDKGLVQKDVVKLGGLPNVVCKYLILLDEALCVSESNIEILRDISSEYGVVILSNNKKFYD